MRCSARETYSSLFIAEIVDHIPQRLRLAIRVERQRPVRQAVAALVPDRHPGVTVGDAPGGDALGPRGGADRLEEIVGARRDDGVANGDRPGQLLVDHVQLGDADRKTKRVELGDEVVEAVTVDLILTADVALQADAVQRHAAIEQAVNQLAQYLALLRRSA